MEPGARENIHEPEPATVDVRSHVSQLIDDIEASAPSNEELGIYYTSEGMTLHHKIMASITNTTGEVPKAKEMLACFFDTLFEKIARYERDQDREHYERYTAIANAILSSGWEIEKFLPLSDRLTVVSRALRINELEQSWHNLLGEFLFDLSRNENQQKAVDYFVETANEKSIPEILDFLRLCEKLIALALDNGHFEKAIPNILNAVRKLHEINAYPFIRYRAEVILEKATSLHFIDFIRQQSSKNLPKNKNGEVLVANDYTGSLNRSGNIAALSSSRHEGNPQSIRRVLSDPKNLPYSHDVDVEQTQLMFEQLQREDLRFFIEKKFHVSLSEITLRSEIQLLDFLSKQNNETLDRIERLTEKPGFNALAFFESFFALNENKELGTFLLAFAETHDAATANQIFEKYQHLTSTIDDIEENVDGFFRGQKRPIDTRKAIREHLRRSNNILRDVCARADVSTEDVAAHLDTIEESALMFGVIFKTVFKENPTIDVSEVEGMSLEQIAFETLSDEEKKDMRAIVEHHWKPRGEYGENIIRKFNALMESDAGSRFYIMKKDGKIVSFIRFKDKKTKPGERPRKEGGYFNVDPHFQGFAFGDVMMIASIQKESETGIIDAAVHPDFPIGVRYVEDAHCDIVGLAPDDVGTLRFILECDKETYGNLPSRRFSPDEIKTLLTETESLSVEDQIKNEKQTIGIRFRSGNKADEKTIQRLTTHAYRGTRYAKEPNKTSILVFDKKKDA